MGGVCGGDCCACCTRAKLNGEISKEELIANARTGDVIILSRGGCNCFQQCVTGHVWVHVGMVFEDTDIKFTIEAENHKVVIETLEDSLELWDRELESGETTQLRRLLPANCRT